MILIADGGSTKTNWCFLDDDGKKMFLNTEGYNPYFVTTGYITNSLEEKLKPQINRNNITEIHFYGAGCFPERSQIVKDALSQIFQNAQVHIELDLLAAARSLLGYNPGFAAILGTGTNTCMYNGEKVIENIDSLGYILGDEGSGSAIGKKLLSDFARGYMPEMAQEYFRQSFNLTKEEIFNNIYSNPLANRFCASFSQFINTNITVEYFHDLVKSSFTDFFKNLVCHYKNYKDFSFNCIGSIGYIFQPILKEVVSEFGMHVGNITQSSIEGLVSYHLIRTAITK